ncbi:MAG: hypothetical protein WAO21_02345 [Verrucomicrobiia bacterium]
MNIIEDSLNSESSEAYSFSTLSLPVGAEFLPTANIATHLLPRVEPFLQRDSSVDIIGNDGPNLILPNYPWFEALVNWAKQGCRIRYFLLKPTPKALDALNEIKAKAGERFNAFNLKRGEKIEGEWADIIRDWENFHFVLFSKPKQLWVETDHPPGVPDAKDCYFLPPSLAEKAGIYEVLKSRFDYVLKRFAEPV